MSAVGRQCQDDFATHAKCCGTAFGKEGSSVTFAALIMNEWPVLGRAAFRCVVTELVRCWTKCECAAHAGMAVFWPDAHWSDQRSPSQPQRINEFVRISGVFEKAVNSSSVYLLVFACIGPRGLCGFDLTIVSQCGCQ